MSRRHTRLALITALVAATLAAAAPAHALRVATWNLLAYDDAAVPSRRPNMIQVVPGLNPDVMIVQELLTSVAADSFANLLKGTMPGRVWKGGSSTFILGTQSAIYYDSLKVSISNLTAVTTGGPRQVLVALVRPNGYLANAANLYLLTASVNWALEREALVAIPPKAADQVSVTLSRGDIGRMTIVSLLLLPLAAIGFGLAVWVKRRR